MRPAHRHSLGHEHEYEPQYGLPEKLPAGERLLWQGAPEWRALAIEVFHVRKLALYFAVILLLRAGFVLNDGGGAMGVLMSWAWLGPMAGAALGILLILARLAARTTVYTVTSQRVILRIGIVLTVAYNLPFKRIKAAGLMLRGSDGHGDLPLTLNAGERIAILQLWPHARPWHVARPQPMLRGLKDAVQVGQLLTQAWQAAQQPEVVAGLPTGAPRVVALGAALQHPPHLAMHHATHLTAAQPAGLQALAGVRAA